MVNTLMDNLDELIYTREQARLSKNWNLCDSIRKKLDEHLIFVFDTPSGQEIHYLTDSFFKKMPPGMNKRKWVEHRIQQDIKAEKRFNAWLFTVNSQR